MCLCLSTAYSTDGILNIFPSLTAANTGLPLEEALVDIFRMSNCPLLYALVLKESAWVPVEEEETCRVCLCKADKEKEWEES